jgi:hypothetical protein
MKLYKWCSVRFAATGCCTKRQIGFFEIEYIVGACVPPQDIKRSELGAEDGRRSLTYTNSSYGQYAGEIKGEEKMMQ